MYVCDCMCLIKGINRKIMIKKKRNALIISFFSLLGWWPVIPITFYVFLASTMEEREMSERKREREGIREEDKL